MCLGIPGLVVEVGPGEHSARVDVLGATREVDVFLVEGEVVPGDWLLIHVGFAIARIDTEEAGRTIELLDEMLAAERRLAEEG